MSVQPAAPTSVPPLTSGPLTVKESQASAEPAAPGRVLRVRAYGDTADEIELCALDEARRVFGGDVPVTVDRSYMIFKVAESASAAPAAAGGKGYAASVDVRETSSR